MASSSPPVKEHEQTSIEAVMPVNIGGELLATDDRTGEFGEVLTSQGPGLEPIWARPTGGPGGGVIVIDNLNSTQAAAALSANQGRVLNLAKANAGPVNDSLLTAAGLRLVGNSAAASGPVHEIALGSGLSLSGGVLSVDAGRTDLSVAARSATGLTVVSSTGNDAPLPAATTALAGLITGPNQYKLDGIAPGATRNLTDAQLLALENATGTLDGGQLSGLYTSSGLRLSGPQRLLGRWSAATGPAQEVQIGPGLDLTGGILSATGGGGSGGGEGTVSRVEGGAGLSGVITTTGALAVGAGIGIRVGADDVAIDRAVVDAWYASAAQGDLAESALQSLPIATRTALGGVKAGSGIEVAADGTISAQAQAGTGTDLNYVAATRLLESSTGADTTLPLASRTVDGLISAADQAKLEDIAPGATANAGTVTSVSGVGGLIGEITSSGSLAVDRSVTDTWYASAAQGALADTALQELPIASATVLGGVKVGSGIYVASDGTISAEAAEGTGTDLNYVPATRVLESSTGADTTLPLFAADAAGLVPAPGASSGRVLRDDGTWAAPAAGGATSLDGLSDVTVASPAEGQVLAFVGGQWVNLAPPQGGGGTVTQVSGTGGLSGTVTTSGSLSIDRATVDTWYASAAQGALADSALQPGEAATSAQGALADSALQSGANISSLTNDAGFTANAGTVTSVSGSGGLAGTVTASGSLSVDRAAVDTWYLPRDISSLPVLP